MSHYKPYPAYKDSGVEWLGRVPEHWAVCKLSFRYSIELGKMLDEKKLTRTSLVPYLRNQDVQWGSINTQDLPEMDIQPDELERYTIRDGDLLVCEGGDVGRAAIWQGESAVLGYQKALHRLRHRSGDADTAKFFYFSLLTAKQRGVFEESDSKATIAHLPAEKFRQYRFVFPPLAEQLSIAEHLDRETARIDALIEKKTRFIELLREKRQALITYAVTKGLDPNVKMKDSGVEWLGEVPEHWRVMAIKHVVATPITDGPHETPEFFDEGVPFVSAEAVSSGWVDFSKIRGFISRVDHERYARKYCPQRGDIFMIKSGATTGVTAIVETDEEFNIWSPLAVIRCGEVAEPYFVLNFMRSRCFQEAIALSWNYGTQQNIGMGVIGSLAVTVPPLEEQKDIARIIQARCHRLDVLVDKTEHSITLLKERRSALITAAVTGQIDLREAV